MRRQWQFQTYAKCGAGQSCGDRFAEAVDRLNRINIFRRKAATDIKHFDFKSGVLQIDNQIAGGLNGADVVV